jgi:hypothetical protein
VAQPLEIILGSLGVVRILYAAKYDILGSEDKRRPYI